MGTTITILIVFILGVSGIGYLIWKKLPQLRIVDPGSSKEAKAKQVKNQIIKQRLGRSSEKHVDKMKGVGTGFQTLVRRVAGKLTAVERRYQEQQKKQVSGGVLTDDMLNDYMMDAKRLMEEGAWERAEKKYIEIISCRPKYAKAYEYLGRLYFAKKDYDLALETFEFLNKLAPKDASVITSLGEVAERKGESQKAFNYFKKAVKLSPKNPKYLDFLIGAAVAIEDRVEAQEALNQLKNVNPDNQKIEDLQEQIDDLPKLTIKKAPATKTTKKTTAKKPENKK